MSITKTAPVQIVRESDRVARRIVDGLLARVTQVVCYEDLMEYEAACVRERMEDVQRVLRGAEDA